MNDNHKTKGFWIANSTFPLQGMTAIQSALEHVAHPVFIIRLGDEIGVSSDGTVVIGEEPTDLKKGLPLLGYSPALMPEDLGDPAFKKAFGLKYAYICGAMANGITSAEMVEAAGNNGMMGFFGAAGLPVDKISEAIDRLSRPGNRFPFGFNLIYSPNEPRLELEVVKLYLEKKVRRISASAYLNLSLPIVYYRIKGIYQDENGKIICPNKVIAKLSRVEVARRFLSPPPEKIINELLEKKLITAQEADLSRKIPMADAITAEADSGGHTDNRPALALLPTIQAVRDEITQTFSYPEPIYVGLGGGIATPDSAAAAFAMGAAYVLTGSVNQSCIESGTSDAVRNMLCLAKQADVTMAPSADMFEMGVKVQVLKRGTMFSLRAAKLYTFYQKFSCIEKIPDKERKMLEKDIFQRSFEEEWEHTKAFFQVRDPAQIERAERDPRHKMALTFRSYLGQSSGWATRGVPHRKMDYQIWCGPSMGAFNQWVKGSFLEPLEQRKTATVAMNLLYGAAVLTRANWLRYQGVCLPTRIGRILPLPLQAIHERLS